MRLIHLASFLSVMASVSPAMACSFHGYTPQPTMVERLFGSEHIVLARPTPDNPFRFSEITALVGSAEYVEIPDLVDTTIRQRLLNNPEDHVLYARDGAYGPWTRLGYINDDAMPVLQVVMQNLPTWRLGNDRERFSYFATLLNHPDKEIHALALSELDLADYSILRSLPLDIDTYKLQSRLDISTETFLAPIRILLLGLSPSDEVQPFLEAGVARNIDVAGSLLGAYATAMIENGGAASVQRLIDAYITRPDVSLEAREMLAEALVIHSLNGDSDTQRAVQAALSNAIITDPSLAAPVARRFGARYDWSLGDAIYDVMRSGKIRSPLETLLLTQYVTLAREGATQFDN